MAWLGNYMVSFLSKFLQSLDKLCILFSVKDNMQAILSKNISQIQNLCKKYRIKRLWAFGSVLRKDFSLDSDIDVLYELDHDKLEGRQHLDYFFGFLDEMQSLLGRKIDTVWYPGIKNPYFKEEIEETKVLLYEQEPEKISV